MRLDQKTIRGKEYDYYNSIPSDLDKQLFDASIRDKGYSVIYEKAYACPCAGQGNDFLSDCKNCGGSGWLFANPIRTKMILTAITSEKRYEEFGKVDVGMVNVTAFPTDKLSRMDRIVIEDGTSEYSEILFPKLKNDGSSLFSLCKYDIKYIDYIALFQGSTLPLKRLFEGEDYTFYDNILTLDEKYNDLIDPSITIRYGHSPMYYIWDIGRDTLESTQTMGDIVKVIHLPIHAVAKKAHLIKDSENLLGDRLIDNSWLPECSDPGLDQFSRKLKYTTIESIWSTLTTKQKADLQSYIETL